MSGVLTGLFGNSGEDAYKKLAGEIQNGMNARKHYEGNAEEALNPYMGDPRLQNQYEHVIAGGEDFQGLLNKLMGGYKESDYAKYLTGQGMNAIQNQGAASGMHGSGAEQQALQKNAMNIASGDLQQYLGNALGLRSDYLNRLGGLAANESNQQFNARMGIGNWRNQLGNNLADDYGNLGKAEYGQQSAKDQRYNDILGSIGNLASSFFSGGGIF